MVYIDDVADAFTLAVSSHDTGVFNVVDDSPLTGSELLSEYQRHGERLRVIRVPGWAVGSLSRLCQWYHRWSRGQLPDVLVPSARLYALLLAGRVCLAVMIVIGVWARPSLASSALFGMWMLDGDLRPVAHHHR